MQEVEQMRDLLAKRKTLPDRGSILLFLTIPKSDSAPLRMSMP